MSVDPMEALLFSDEDNQKEKESDRWLHHLQTGVRELQQKKNLLAQKEDEIKQLKKEITVLEENELPGFMDSMGCESIKVNNITYSIEPFIHSSITAANKDSAYAWLKEKGYGDVVKEEITIKQEAAAELARCLGEDGTKNIADQINKHLSKPGLESKESIHHSTLRRVVKELFEKGETIPETINIYQGRKVVTK